MSEQDIQERPVELLQHLLRFDTTNPPGAEGECMAWVAELLRGVGCEPRMLADASGRPNVVARLAGRGEAPPLLLQGHVDVVAARGEWLHAPFAGEVHDGYVWGRGALDMKGGVAMMLAAFMRAALAEAPPPGDLIMCVLADEEAGSDHGAEFLVREHPELFDGVRYSIGEFGGFTTTVAGQRFYPIMVAEKPVCWTRATLRGAAGHGSLAVRGGVMGALGRALAALDERRLPVHVTPVTRAMVEAIAAEVPDPPAGALRQLLDPDLTDGLLDAVGPQGALFDPLLHNTANPTIVHGGEKINVVPDEVSLEIDCRLLPGFGPEELFAELRELTQVEMELEVIRHDGGAGEPDMAMFDLLAGALRELDADARPIPLLLPGATDGRFFARLGIQTYGFLPMQLPEDMAFMELIHAPNERLPVASLEFGTSALGRVLERFG